MLQDCAGPRGLAASAGAHGLQFWAAEKLTHVGTFMNLPHYLPWVDYRACGYYFDTLGNVLAVLSGIADEPFAAEILAYGEMVGIELPFPCRAVDPVAYPGGPDWMDMYHNFGLGRPHQYVNGGGWPFIGGLWVIALQWLGRLQAAQRVLRGLEQAVCVPRGEDAAPDFAEWLHAVSGRPGGRTRQAWSAGGYLGACAALNEGNDPWQDYIVG